MLVLGLEIVLTLSGFWMLFAGKAWGKEAVKHWQYRLLGGFLITLVPLVFTTAFIYAVIYSINHPDITPDQVQKDIRWPITGIEFAFCVVYGLTATFWDSRIRKKVAAQSQLSDTELA